MSILRNPVQGNFSIIANDLITNKEISHGAFRVACYLLSRPDGWDVRNDDIQRKIGIKQAHTLSKYWKELLTAGVMFRRKRMDGSGKFCGGYDYAIYEKPLEWTGGQIVEKPHCDESTLWKNHIHNNTDISNTDLNNTEETFSDENEGKGNNFIVVTTADADVRKKVNPDSVKPKKERNHRRLYQSDIDRGEYPYVWETMDRLHRAVKGHEEKGYTHNFALDSSRRELTVSIDHLDTMEDHLSELGCYASEGQEYGYVADRIVKLYNARARKRKEPVNLAFLCGVNMPWFDDEINAESYVAWVNDFVLAGE